MLWVEGFSATFVSINPKTCELFKGNAMLSATDFVCLTLE
jgi:hypothetical protein